MLDKCAVIRQYETGNREIEFYHTFDEFDRYGHMVGSVTETKLFRNNITNSSRRRINHLLWSSKYHVTPWVGHGLVDITLRRKLK